MEEVVVVADHAVAHTVLTITLLCQHIPVADIVHVAAMLLVVMADSVDTVDVDVEL